MQMIYNKADGGTLSRWLARGVDGIAELLAILRNSARAGATDAGVRGLAERIAAAAGRDLIAQAAAVQAWVRANIAYVTDPRGVELVKSPARLLMDRADDCDGHAQLVAAMLASIGHRVRLSAIGRRPGIFEHVFCESLIGGVWRSVETTLPGPVPVGFAHPGVVVKLVAELANDDAPTLAGFSLKKIVKKVAKPVLKVGKIAAAVTVPGAAGALVALESAKGQTAQAKAVAAQANAQAAIATAAAAPAAPAPAPAPMAPAASGDWRAWIETNKAVIGLGLAGVVAVSVLSRGGSPAR